MVITTFLVVAVCVVPSESRPPFDADLLRPELGEVRYLRNINDAIILPCNPPRRDRELVAPLSFDKELFRSIETI